MDRHNNGRTASPESGLERREQMQKSVKKSNKKTGAAGKYTASGAFGGAQPSNLVELIEAQRGKAASSAGKKPAADTALANEWANLQLQSFGQFGADPAAIAGQQAGQTAGDWLENQLAQTGFNEDESKLAYLGEKFTNGAHRAVEGAYNNAIDNSRAQVDAQLRNGFVTDTGVNQRDIQNALASIFGGKYAQHAQDTQAADLAVAAELSGAADGLRSTRAAEYGRDIDERYGATGLWKLGGDVAAGAGQMLPTIGINAVTGGRLGTPFLLSSAAGNAAAEARAGGADEETAFLYGILSGGVEAATERISAGIPGLNKTGLLDDVLSRVASSPTGRGAVKKLVDVLGEGAEEYISEIAGAYLARLWNGDERGAWQTFVETQPDALYAGLVGTLTSAVMNLPGEAYALARKNKPGAVPDAQQSGNSVPRLFTRDEVQGMSAGEVRENYDAVRKSMEMWDENGELQGGTQSRMVDRQAPGEDNETTSGNERLYTRAEVQRMSEEEQLANVDAIRESMGLWDAEGKLAEQGSNSPDDGWDVQGKEAFKSNEEAYEYYLKVANELDVSTSFNTAVFYSGPGNRALAEAFARENNKTTLEITEGGKYLDALHLFSNESALTTEQAANVWKKLSERYAQGASGNAYGFVKGSRDGSIFNTVEYPALKSNPDITNIFTELFQKGENE